MGEVFGVINMDNLVQLSIIVIFNDIDTLMILDKITNRIAHGKGANTQRIGLDALFC